MLVAFKRTKGVLVALTIIALMNLLMSCSQTGIDPVASHDSDTSASLSGNVVDSVGPIKECEFPKDYPFPDPGPYELLNGSTLAVDSVQYLDESTALFTSMAGSDGTPSSVLILVSYDLTGFRIVSDAGDTVYSYGLGLSADTSMFVVSVATPQDQLTASFTIGEMSATYVLNGNELHLEFESQEEMDRAVMLYESVSEGASFALSDHDQALLKMVADYSGLINSASSIVDNAPAEAASYLMADEGFVSWMLQHTPQQKTDSNLELICAMASLASLICFCPLPPCWIICIPALGVSIACAVSTIIDKGVAWLRKIF